MPTLKQKDNLRTLAGYLRSLPYDYEHFDISTFYYEEESGITFSLSEIDVSKGTELGCGTVACAVGHGPSAGIKINCDNWITYCKTAFGVSMGGEDASYMFGEHWADCQPHHWQAAERIEYWLEHGALAYVYGDIREIMAQPLPMAKKGPDDIVGSVKQE